MSREASQSIKAGIDSPLTSTTARCSEELTLREMNQLNSNMRILSTTEKYGQSSPRKLTPRSSRRDGSSTSGQTVAARSQGGGKNSGSPKKYTTPIRELDRMAIEAKAPPRFICPISGRVMRDPIILATGTTCDRCALEKRLANGNKRCPVTNKNLRVPISMTPNSELRNSISAWARKNAPWMMDTTGMFLLTNEPGRYELQGSDVQYVSSPASAGLDKTPSRIDGAKGQWLYTNGSKARPGHHLNMTATPGTLESGRAPWYTSRGIASPRSSRKSSRSRSHRGGSPRKSTKVAVPLDWYSLGFIGIMSVVYVAMFVLSLSFDDWKFAPMSKNPWFGPSPEALVDSGAIVLPLMNTPGNEWWRLLSSAFLPAGLIQTIVCLLFLWMFGMYARTCLPLPQISLAGIVITSSIVGSLCSANLNSKYIACGPFSGILSLFAVICVNQPLAWPQRKLLNLKEWYLIAILLLVLGGGLITLSLFPLVDIWFSLGGFLGGLCLSLIALLIPRVQSKALGDRRKYIWIQSLSAVILLGVIIAASVGCALPTKLGQSIDGLAEVSCIEFSPSMKCTPYGFLDNGCGLVWSEQSVYVACPEDTSSGYQYYPTNSTFAGIGDPTIIEIECQKQCDKRTDTISVISVPPVPSLEEEDLILESMDMEEEGNVTAPIPVAAKAPATDITTNKPISNPTATATPPEVSLLINPSQTRKEDILPATSGTGLEDQTVTDFNAESPSTMKPQAQQVAQTNPVTQQRPEDVVIG